jgi:preprotein translocase subunit SecG
MINVLLIVHIIVAMALIGVVLVQKNEGGGLGIGGGGGGGMSGLMTGRGAANLLTRVTKYLAGIFMILSLALTIMMNQRQESGSLVDQLRDSGTPGATGEGTAGEGGTTPSPAPSTTEPAPKVE